MTGHTSDEVIDVPQDNRSTDSESATKQPAGKQGIVQDSPGNPEVGTTDGELIDNQGDYKKDDSTVLDSVEPS